MSDLLTDLQRHAERLGLEGFARAFPHGFLLHRPVVGVEIDPLAEDGTERYGVATKLVPKLDLDFDRWEDDLLDTDAAYIVPVQGAPASLHDERITIGRAVSCDVVLRFLPVSKLHAQFELEQHRVVRVRDLQSANGTFVHGARLAVGVSHPVSFGAKISFGALEFEWVNPVKGYAVLETL